MQIDHVSETAFLLIELRYTLAQLRAQLGDLDESARIEALGDGQTVNTVLAAMSRYETEYQAHYAQLLQVAPLPDGTHEGEIPGYDTFEREREQTLGMLDRAGDDWSQALLDTVKQQVADDREHATRIAEYRRELLERRSTGL